MQGSVRVIKPRPKLGERKGQRMGKKQMVVEEMRVWGGSMGHEGKFWVVSTLRRARREERGGGRERRLVRQALLSPRCARRLTGESITRDATKET